MQVPDKATRPLTAVVRWLLTAPAAVAGFYTGILIFFLLRAMKESWCPDAYLVSGMCHAPWSWQVEQCAFGFGAFVSGSLFVLLPALAAPSHRKAVALSFYALGLTCAVFFWIPGKNFEKISAAVGGAVAVWRIYAVTRKGAA